MRLMKILTYHIVLLLLASCFACNGAGKGNKTQGKGKPKDNKAFVIATLPTLDCMPLYLAKEKGLLAENGIPVELRQYNAQMDCDTAILHGRVHGVVTDLVRVEHMRKKNAVLEYFTSTNLAWRLYSNKAARIKTVKQLSEKMVGMTRFSGTDYWTDAVVKEEKPKNEVFRIQLNDLNVRMKMLQNNEIDAVWLPDPYATTAKVDKHQLVYDTEGKTPMLGVIAFDKKERGKRLTDSQFRQLVEVYNQMCDSLNLNGAKHYRDVLAKYYRLEQKAIEALPKVRFNHVMQPRAMDVNAARNF